MDNDGVRRAKQSINEEGDDENAARRQGEVEFVEAAYSPEEAWWCSTSSLLSSSDLPHDDDDDDDAHKQDVVVHRRLYPGWILKITMPPKYPSEACLQVDGSLDDETMDANHRKMAFRALPALLDACRQEAEALLGEEALFAVFSIAEEWVQGEWELFKEKADSRSATTNGCSPADHHQEGTPSGSRKTPLQLGRRLIYSHHIIAKRKRADIQRLAKDFQLTGYIKIGWPGLILIEGSEEDCLAFYDAIRGWNWQYLVVRGEMQEPVISSKDINCARRFSTFLEVSDMSIVANHCREVGLEALFRTSMKVYDNASDDGGETNNIREAGGIPHGALIHVDHMNDGKSYRKWLRKTAHDLGVSVVVRQCFPNQDYSKRPVILVGLVGEQESVAAVLKQWRTRKVDVDSRGKPCLERQMTVLLEGPVQLDADDWEDCQDHDRKVNTSREKLEELLRSIGGNPWVEAAASLWNR